MQAVDKPLKTFFFEEMQFAGGGAPLDN